MTDRSSDIRLVLPRISGDVICIGLVPSSCVMVAPKHKIFPHENERDGSYTNLLAQQK